MTNRSRGMSESTTRVASGPNSGLPIDVSDPSTVDRFWAKVDQTGECWIWTAALDAGGYGNLRASGRKVKAHRLAYTLLVGPIPVGLPLDHLCRNRACVNPAHLEPVTQATNILRGVSTSALNAMKVECPQGHPFSGANLRLRPGGRRKCRACHNASERVRRAVKRASELVMAA